MRTKAGSYDDLVLPQGVMRVSLGEGSTPLLRADDALLKCEHLNPTGSYKDRVASVAISLGAAQGAGGWVGTSSGNAGAAFAAYGARAGLPGWLFTVDGMVDEKLAHARVFGTEVWEVADFGRDPEVESEVFQAVAEVAAAEGLVVAITANTYNAPAMTGIKEIAYELVEELGRAPNVVYVPTGGGGLLASLWHGFEDALALGLTSTLPRLVAVQPEGCAPVHLAAERGDPSVSPVDTCTSAISGLQLTNPPDGDLALDAVRVSKGWTMALTDADAFVAGRTLATRHGVFVEPAAALAFAAYCADPVDDAVVLMTGNGLKSLTQTEPAGTRRRLRAGEIAALLARGPSTSNR